MQNNQTSFWDNHRHNQFKFEEEGTKMALRGHFKCSFKAKMFIIILNDVYMDENHCWEGP